MARPLALGDLGRHPPPTGDHRRRPLTASPAASASGEAVGPAAMTPKPLDLKAIHPGLLADIMAPILESIVTPDTPKNRSKSFITLPIFARKRQTLICEMRTPVGNC
jgi:hypothetical protein